jgi:hypothetical protein
MQPAGAVGPRVQITAGGGNVVMAERRLNLGQCGAPIYCMGAVGVPQPVR